MGSSDAADVAAAADVSRTSTRLAKLAVPVVEQVAQHLAQGGDTQRLLKVPTLLTQRNRMFAPSWVTWRHTASRWTAP